MDKVVFRLAIVLAVLLVSACAGAPQQAIPLDEASWQQSVGKVVFIVDPVPSPTMTTPGAGCLLCIGVARAANSSLIDHAETLSSDDLAVLRLQLQNGLERRGIATVPAKWAEVEELPKFKSDLADAANKDFSALGEKYAASHVLVVNFNLVGFVRNYASYIPSGDPVASVAGAAYLVDVKTNRYEWYLPINVAVQSDGAWDEPPHFPGLTNAYYQAIEIAKQRVLAPFAAPQAARLDDGSP